MKCYACGDKLTPKNITNEHIIINAAGGRLKSKKLICLKCNSEFGEGIDAALAQQLNPIANLLMIKRDKGEPQPILGEKKSTGEKYLLEVGGTPKRYEPKVDICKENGEVTKISISARSEQELKKIIKNISKKVPQIDVDEAMRNAESLGEKFNEPLNFNLKLGGESVFRAVCKCAVNFFVYKNGDVSQIRHLLPYVKGGEGRDLVWFHYQDNLYDLAQDECCHLLHLIGNREDRTLYCYVDYFNAYKFLVLLNDNYIGDDIDIIYCFDVLNIKTVNKQTNVNYNREKLLSFFKNKDVAFFTKAENALGHSTRIGRKRQMEYQFHKAFERAINNSLGKYPNGTIITETMVKEATNEIVKELIPFFIRPK